MTEYGEDPTYDSDDNSDMPDRDIPSLRRAANKASKLEKENADLRRRLAFADAGISSTDPRMTYFVKGYDGDLSPEAIRAAASEAGFIQAPQETQEQRDDAQAERRIVAASSGAEPYDASKAAAMQALEDAMKAGGLPAMLTQAQALGVVVDQGS